MPFQQWGCLWSQRGQAAGQDCPWARVARQQCLAGRALWLGPRQPSAPAAVAGLEAGDTALVSRMGEKEFGRALRSGSDLCKLQRQ